MKSRILGALCAVFFTFTSVSANAALVSRLGGDAAWDDELGITWLTDADLSGVGTWHSLSDWIASLNAGSGHLGYTDWRLASMSVTAGVPDAGFQTSIDSCTTGVVCPTNELGHMYYYNLGGTGNDLNGDQTVGDVTLTGIQAYRSSTEFDLHNAWIFSFGSGIQGSVNKSSLDSFYGWAVRVGDVGPPPAIVTIDIEPDGTEQECSEQGGTTVQLTAEVDGANFTSFLWTIDGEDAGSTKTIPAFLELGQHSVRVDVMADNGATASSTENVIVEDTTAPVINAAFLNSKTGTEITVINSKDQADISISVSDLCDGTPSSSATAGLPVFDGNTISAKTSNKDSSVKLSIEGNADNVELMVTAEDASGNKSNAKTTLIVAQ